jgi:tripartite-type tricarboxylate transporter receptor subunit TctC
MKTSYPAISIMALCATLLTVTQSPAQTFPTKTVRIVVPYAAGGPVDTVTRIAAQNLTRKWGQQVIVDNRAGSGGALGTQAVVKAPPDGYTLLITNSGPITSYPHMRKTLLYDFERDLAPISLLSQSSIVLVVHPSLPARSVPEFVALAKKHPGTLTYATSGVGGVQHLAMVLLESLAGIDLIHVPYKGAAPAVVDVLSGQVPVQFNSVLGSIQNIKAGKLRALGVSTAQPSAVLPGVPPIAKYYPEFEITSWLGMYAPAGTPQPLIDQLNRDIAAALNVPESKKRLNDLGLDLVVSPPAELTAYAQKESRLFGKLMAKAGIVKE